MANLQDQKRLVLCFDGTANRYHGGEGDSNIIKIYEMLDRNAENQYHYYQPGIGTYVDSDAYPFLGPINNVWTKSILTIDQMLGTSFKSHVIAGYNFIMRYFSPGDCIYIFGFSRGAYTARFLAEMLSQVGLLSKGNEEMIHFAWQTFSDYQRSDKNNDSKKAYMEKFKQTFCRDNVNVHFLGLFDCVNSVGQFESPFWRTSYPYIATPPATHIRHAVSVHERRVKFKPALMAPTYVSHEVDLKEVWFAGDHSDIGGGWKLRTGQERQLSETPLQWMIDEVTSLEGTEHKLMFSDTKVKTSQEPILNLDTQEASHDITIPRMHLMKPHDSLAFDEGFGGIMMALMWWLIEILPIFSRLELEDDKWVPTYWPPSRGERRDIPRDAVIHESVYRLHKAGVLTDEELPKLGGAVCSRSGHEHAPQVPVAPVGNGYVDITLINGNAEGTGHTVAANADDGGHGRLVESMVWNNVNGDIMAKSWL